MKRSLTVLFVAAIAFLSLEIKTRAALVFIDRFEYDVSRTNPNAVDLFRQQGWATAKTQQSPSNGANGYLYTVTSIPGYSGPLPGNNSSRVLAIEALPGTLQGQTDFYLQLGTGQVQNAIPGDVWIQFWLYPQDSGSQRSRYTSNKFFYVCKDAYPCHSHTWMLIQGAQNFHASNSFPYGETAAGNFMWAAASSAGASNISYAGPGADVYASSSLGHNRSPMGMERNRWTLVKMHFNTTRTSGNSWEMWMRTYGGNWTKTAEWIGGVTPGFTWNIPSGSVGGHASMRMPTTVGRPDNQWYDYWMYMDDFAMATMESDLPTYTDGGSGGGSSSRPASPTNLRIISAFFQASRLFSWPPA